MVGDNWTLDLLSGSDVVSVGGVSAGTVSLFTVTHQTTEFDIDPFTGILGERPIGLEAREASLTRWWRRPGPYI